MGSNRPMPYPLISGMTLGNESIRRPITTEIAFFETQPVVSSDPIDILYRRDNNLLPRPSFRCSIDRRTGRKNTRGYSVVRSYTFEDRNVPLNGQIHVFTWNAFFPPSLPPPYISSSKNNIFLSRFFFFFFFFSSFHDPRSRRYATTIYY